MAYTLSGIAYISRAGAIYASVGVNPEGVPLTVYRGAPRKTGDLELRVDIDFPNVSLTPEQRREAIKLFQEMTELVKAELADAVRETLADQIREGMRKSAEEDDSL